MLFGSLPEPQKGLKAGEHRGRDADDADEDLETRVDVVLERGENARSDEGREYHDRDTEHEVPSRQAVRG